MWWSQRGRRWQYGGALHAGLVRLYARKHMLAFVHPHTFTQKYVIFIAFPMLQLFHGRASVLRYTYIACLLVILIIFVVLHLIKMYQDMYLFVCFQFCPAFCLNKTVTRTQYCLGFSVGLWFSKPTKHQKGGLQQGDRRTQPVA